MENLQSAYINGQTIHWFDKGQGKTVILVPGSNGDFRAWTNQMDAFSKHFRTIAISRRFQFPEKYIAGGSSSVDDNCNDLLQLLSHLNISKVSLVGHSFGGYIALAFAEKYPDKIDKLVLEEPTVFPFIMRKAFNPLQLIPLFIEDFGVAASFLRTGLKGIKPTKNYLSKGEIEKAKLAFANGIVGHSITLDELNPIMRQGLDDNIKTFAGESKSAFSYSLTVERIKKMQTNTLLIESDKSPKWFSYICKKLKEHLPHAELKQISAPTHWLHIDLPNEFNKTVISFLMS